MRRRRSTHSPTSCATHILAEAPEGSESWSWALQIALEAGLEEHAGRRSSISSGGSSATASGARRALHRRGPRLLQRARPRSLAPVPGRDPGTLLLDRGGLEEARDAAEPVVRDPRTWAVPRAFALSDPRLCRGRGSGEPVSGRRWTMLASWPSQRASCSGSGRWDGVASEAALAAGRPCDGDRGDREGPRPGERRPRAWVIGRARLLAAASRLGGGRSSRCGSPYALELRGEWVAAPTTGPGSAVRTRPPSRSPEPSTDQAPARRSAVGVSARSCGRLPRPGIRRASAAPRGCRVGRAPRRARTRGSDAQGGGGSGAGRGGASQLRDRRAPRAFDADGRPPRLVDPAQARGPHAGRGERRGPEAGRGRPRSVAPRTIWAETPMLRGGGASSFDRVNVEANGGTDEASNSAASRGDPGGGGSCVRARDPKRSQRLHRPAAQAGDGSVSTVKGPAEAQPAVSDSGSGSFDWVDASVGAAISLGFVAAIGAGVVLVRRRTPHPSHT